MIDTASVVEPKAPVPTSNERQRLQALTAKTFPLYGNVIAPATISDLVLLFEQLALVATGWRGQATIRWPLHSSLARRVLKEPQAPVLDEPVVLENVVREAEARTLERARQAGLGRQGGRELADLELLALLQHHGAATRLVDCTKNFFVAAWFAAKDHRDEWGLVAGFDLAKAIHINTLDLQRKKIQDLLDDEVHDGFAWWQPSSLSPRMPAQQGFFVFSRATIADWGSLVLKGDVFSDTGNVPGLPLIAISPKLKLTLNDVWHDVFGYSDETMFPDLDGFASAHGPTRPWPPRFFEGPDITRRLTAW